MGAFFRVRSRAVSLGLTSRRLGRDKPDSETDDFSYQFLGRLTSCLRWTRLQKENPGFTPQAASATITAPWGRRGSNHQSGPQQGSPDWCELQAESGAGPWGVFGAPKTLTKAPTDCMQAVGLKGSRFSPRTPVKIASKTHRVVSFCPCTKVAMRELLPALEMPTEKWSR